MLLNVEMFICDLSNGDILNVKINANKNNLIYFVIIVDSHALKHGELTSVIENLAVENYPEPVESSPRYFS
jgi:hypothetical protein